MLQALRSNGEVVTLSGSMWAGQELTMVEAGVLAGELHCVSPGCSAPLAVDVEGRRFRHEDWRTGCWQSKHHESSFVAHGVTMVERQMIGEHSYSPVGVASARVVGVRGGSPVAVRAVPVSAGFWSAPYREVRDGARSHLASMWLAEDVTQRAALVAGWMQGFVRLALEANLWPVTLGLVDVRTRTVRFVGDVAVEPGEGRTRYRLVSVSDPVSFEAFAWWTRNGGKVPPLKVVDEVSVIEQMSQRKIGLV